MTPHSEQTNPDITSATGTHRDGFDDLERVWSRWGALRQNEQSLGPGTAVIACGSLEAAVHNGFFALVNQGASFDSLKTVASNLSAGAVRRAELEAQLSREDGWEDSRQSRSDDPGLLSLALVDLSGVDVVNSEAALLARLAAPLRVETVRIPARNLEVAQTSGQ